MDRPAKPATSILAFHVTRIVIDVGVLLVLGSMSLDFVSGPAGNHSAMDLDALPALLLVTPAFLATLLPRHTRPLPRPVSWAALTLALAALPYAIVKYLDAGVLAETVSGSLGPGVRLLVFGTLVVTAGVAVGLSRMWRNPAAAAARPVPPPSRREAPHAVAQSASPAAPQPSSRPEAPPRPRPARAAPVESNPFGDPLFDSLEIPATRAEPPRRRQPDLIGGLPDPDEDPDAYPEG